MKKIVLALFFMSVVCVGTSLAGNVSVSADVTIKSFSDKLEARDFFGGGEIDNTSFRDEYEFNINLQYRFTERLSISGSVGYLETPLKDPLITYDDDISAYYPEKIRECTIDNGGSGIVNTSGINTLIFDPEDTPFDGNYFNGNETFIEGSYGDLRQIPVIVSFRVDLMPNLKWKPYLAGGVGYVFNELDEDNSADEYMRNLNYTASVLPYGSLSVAPYTSYNIQADADGDGVADGVVYALAGDYFYLPYAVTEPYEGWTIDYKDSITYHLEAGFDYELAEHWDFVFKIRFNWAKEEIKTRINGGTRFVALTDGGSDFGRPFSTNNNGDLIFVPDMLYSQHGVVVAEGGDMNMNSVQAGIGFKYTF